MAKPMYPSEKLDQYMLRFPDGMRDHLKDEATKNNRSLNAEIIARLEAYQSIHDLQSQLALCNLKNEALNKEMNALSRELRNYQSHVDTSDHLSEHETPITQETAIALVERLEKALKMIEAEAKRARELNLVEVDKYLKDEPL